MARPRLLACPACARHVRITEAACPFCGGVLESARLSFTARAAPTERLSRAALVAFGVGTLAVATGCGGVVSGTTGQETPDAQAPVDAHLPDGNFTVPYGVAPPFDAGEPPPDAQRAFDANYGVPYGLAPFDAGEPPADAEEAFDANYGVPYGIPPSGTP